MSTLRTASAWGLAAVLVFFLAAFLGAVTATQLTSEDTGKKLLRRSVAVTTDIDNALPKIEADLHENAAAADSPEVQVPDWPVLIVVPRDEASTLSGEALRQRLLDESADKLYEDGPSAWSSGDPEAKQDIDEASTAGLVHRGLGVIQDTNHTIFLALAVLLGLIVIGMIIGLVFSLPRDAWLVVVGGVALASSMTMLALAVGMRFAFRTADANGDPFIEGMLDIGADAMWVPIRNFFTTALLGAGLVLTGVLFLWWEARRLARREPVAGTQP